MKLAINTVTLRSSTAEDVVSILKEHDISAVEWAGNEHVPPGDIEVAKRVKGLCEEAGITCTSYGSYYACDDGGVGGGQFEYNLGAEPTLVSAEALGVTAIRVWAGRQASDSTSAEYRAEVVRCLSEFCDKADALGMTVHLEFHRNTLADTAESTVELIKEVGRENLFSYWQPRHGVGVEDNLKDIELLKGNLTHVHVFHWLLKKDGFAVDRRPLSEGKERWAAYLETLKALPGERYAMIEFVRNNEFEQFSEDVAVLKSLI